MLGIAYRGVLGLCLGTPLRSQLVLSNTLLRRKSFHSLPTIDGLKRHAQHVLEIPSEAGQKQGTGRAK